MRVLSFCGKQAAAPLRSADLRGCPDASGIAIGAASMRTSRSHRRVKQHPRHSIERRAFRPRAAQRSTFPCRECDPRLCSQRIERRPSSSRAPQRACPARCQTQTPAHIARCARPVGCRRRPQPVVLAYMAASSASPSCALPCANPPSFADRGLEDTPHRARARNIAPARERSGGGAQWPHGCAAPAQRVR